jgi:aldose sugar dehydrogenase
MGRRWIGLAAAAGVLGMAGTAQAQTPEPTVVDPRLEVRTVTSGLSNPIGMAFTGANEFFVIEKASGQVKRVVDGEVTGTVLDLPVNSASERGLLGIALHAKFSKNGYVYLYWTESATGADSTQLSEVPLLGNRVDRFVWNGTSLTYDKTLVRLRSYQADANQPLRGNHNGGVVRFGPDGKVYVVIGDNGRRGQLQNLIDGPFGEGIPDDQFGGPDPVNDHLTGVILRLNDDGTAPRDNPFWRVGAERGGQVGANLKKIYAYGLRNSFGMAFDPYSGDLWEQENGDDSFSEVNRVEPGFNSGWVQIMGPASRNAQFREIETSEAFRGLQQVRWDPVNIKGDPRAALDSLFRLPGSRFSDPEMTWKYEVAPGGIAFLDGDDGLGRRYDGDLFVGSATNRLEGGHLFRLPIDNRRRGVNAADHRLRDGVADNTAKYDITESETLLFGRNFGVTPDVQSSPDETLYVVSLSLGSIFEIGER